MSAESYYGNFLGFALLSSGANLKGGGLAAINGCTPFPFMNLDELNAIHPDVTWITSMPASEFIKRQGGRKNWLRSANYFNTSIADLTVEMGLDSTDLPRLVTCVSSVLSHVLMTSQDVYPHVFPGEPGSVYSELFKPQWSEPFGQGEKNPDVVAGLGRYLTSTPPQMSVPSAQDLSIILTPYRVAHMEVVTDIKVPSGTWEEVSLVGEKSPYEWIKKSEAPVLALVSLSSPRTELFKLLSKITAKGNSMWMPHAELIEIGQHAELRVHKAYVAQESCHAVTTIPAALPLMEPVDHASISSGLFAESFLAAACHKTQSELGQQDIFLVARAAWLLSAARAKIFKDVVRLTEAGFRVSGYTATNLALVIKKQEIGALRDFIANAPITLMMPARYAAERVAPRPVED